MTPRLLGTKRGKFLVSIPVIVAASSTLLLMDEYSAGKVTSAAMPVITALVAFLAFKVYQMQRGTPFMGIGLVFVLSFTLFSGGWIWWTVASEILGQELSVSIADALWLGGYVLIFGGLVDVMRKAGARPSNDILATELAFWVPMSLLLEYTVHATLTADLTVLEKVVYSAYPVLDSMIITLLIVLGWLNRKGVLEDYWMFLAVAVGFWTVGDLVYGVSSAFEIYFEGSVADMFFMCSYSLLAVGFGLTLSGRQRFPYLVPTVEKTPGKPVPQSLEPKKTYIVYGQDPRRAYDLVVKALGAGLEGLIVARKNPVAVKAEYGLVNTNVLWVSTTSGKDSVSPANLGILTDAVVRFVEHGKDTIVFLDCFESLVTYNDFRKAELVVDHLKDLVAERKSRLVIAVDSRVLSDREAALLEKGAIVLQEEGAQRTLEK